MTTSGRLFDRCLNFLSQPQFGHHAQLLWRARALQGTNLVLIFIYVISMSFLLATEPLGAFSRQYAGYALAPAAGLTFLSLWLTYRARCLVFNVHLTLSALFICAASGIYVNGGPDVSSNNQHLIIQAVIGFYLGGIRGGLIWLVIIFVVEVTFYSMAASGYAFPNYQLQAHLFSGEVFNFMLAFFAVAVLITIMELNRSSLDRYRELEHSRFKYKATHDSLTQLANRELLQSTLAETIERCQESGSKALLFYLDLNNFKPINDTYGHACGDRVLQVVAARLQSMVRKNDLVARVGGDEFAILFQKVESGQPHERMTTALAEHLGEPIYLSGQQFSVGCSIGICEIDGSNSDVEDLLSIADKAMYQAKKSQQLWVLEAGPGLVG